MADSFIRVAPDGTGKEMQTFENLVGANSVHAEAVVLVDQFGVPIASISGGLTDAELRASPVEVVQDDIQRFPGGVSDGGAPQGVVFVEPGGTIGTLLVSGKDGSNLDIGRLADVQFNIATDISVPILAVRKSSPANVSDNNNDYEPLQISAGQLWVQIKDGSNATIGAKGDSSATNDTGGFSYIALFKRLLEKITAKIGITIADGDNATQGVTTGAAVNTDANGTLQQYLRGLVKLWNTSPPTGAATEATLDARTGSLTETAPATDTASSGINGRLQRIAQRLSSHILQFPLTLGAKIQTTSLGVTLAVDEPIVAQLGAVNETAPATDTAASGLNGRLQRIAQRITSFIALLPGSLGQKTMANSLAVTLASDQSALPVSLASIPSHAVTNAGTFAVQNTGVDATNGVQPVVQKKIAASTYSPSLFQNLGANATLNIKASTGNVFSLTCYNANAADRYIQLHNTATTPAGSAVPVFSFLVPPGSQIIIGTDFFTDEGVNFATGIAFGFSTARNIYTAGSAGDHSTWVQYK